MSFSRSLSCVVGTHTHIYILGVWAPDPGFLLKMRSAENHRSIASHHGPVLPAHRPGERRESSSRTDTRYHCHILRLLPPHTHRAPARAHAAHRTRTRRTRPERPQPHTHHAGFLMYLFSLSLSREIVERRVCMCAVPPLEAYHVLCARATPRHATPRHATPRHARALSVLFPSRGWRVKPTCLTTV